MMDVDTRRLPLVGPVLDVSDHHDGRIRVTFKNLAAIYFITEDTPERDSLLAAVRQSKSSGEQVALTYNMDGKSLTGLQ